MKMRQQDTRFETPHLSTPTDGKSKPPHLLIYLLVFGKFKAPGPKISVAQVYFSHMESLAAIFRICMPWIREAPPLMAQATWTASVISSRFEPFSRQA